MKRKKLVIDETNTPAVCFNWLEENMYRCRAMSELTVLYVIVHRLHARYNSTQPPLSLTGIAEITKLNRRSVARALNGLEKKKLLIREKTPGQVNKYALVLPTIPRPKIERVKHRSKNYRKRIVPLIIAQRGLCGICDEPLPETTALSEIHLDHIVRVSEGGSDDRANLRAPTPRAMCSGADHNESTHRSGVVWKSETK